MLLSNQIMINVARGRIKQHGSSQVVFMYCKYVKMKSNK
jgi:hypothetical protein